MRVGVSCLLAALVFSSGVAAEEQRAGSLLSNDGLPATDEAIVHESTGGAITLESERLDIDLDEGCVSARGVRIWACGDCPAPFTVSARRAELEPDGDLDLVLPVLRIGRVPVLALPWVRLRTGRRAGLLLPRLGWRSGGGFEAGEGIWIPLGSRGELSVAAAYLTDLVGAEVSAELEAGRARVAATARLGRDVATANIDGRLAGRRGGLSAAARLGWTLDPEAERRFSMSLADQTRAWEATTLAVSYTTMELQTALTARLVHDLSPAVSVADAYIPSWGLAFDLLPIRLGPFWLGARDSIELTTPFGGGSWPSWRAVFRPVLATAFALGPLSVRWSISSLHAAWEPGRDERYGSGRTAALTGLDVSIPLVKRLGGGRLHTVTPMIRYRLSLADTMIDGQMSAEPWTWPIAGHLAWLGVRSEVREPGGAVGLEVEVGQVLGLPRIAGAPVAPRLEAWLRWQARLAGLETVFSLDEGTWSLGDALVRARIGDPLGLALMLVWRWLGDPATGQVGPDVAAEVPLMLPWFPAGAQAVEGLFTTPLGGGFRLDLGAWLDVEAADFVQVGGSLRYRHRCGCLGASFGAWVRNGRRWPDVWLAVDIGGLAGGVRNPGSDGP